MALVLKILKGKGSRLREYLTVQFEVREFKMECNLFQLSTLLQFTDRVCEVTLKSLSPSTRPVIR